MSATDIRKDTAEIKQTILSFYNWYTNNYDSLGQFKLYKGEQPPYKLDWTEVGKMQSYIRSRVPQLGETFIKNQMGLLHEIDSAFKVDVQDDIPYGFDYDWYTYSQEDPKYLLEEINKSNNWKYDVKGNTAVVDIKTKFLDNGKESESSLIKIFMAKENEVWKIAKIGEIDDKTL
jgi:hypothetical protein